MTFPLFPPSASTMSQRVDFAFLYLLAVCGVVFLGIMAVMVVFLFKYRRGNPANRRPPSQRALKLELSWTLIPLFVFMSFFTWGAVLYFEMQAPPENAININVVGKQWMWKVQHPAGQREINELHVPLGRPVKLTLASQDVIHSFFLPAFRIKQDVVPGRYTTEWFEATRTGTFHIFCAEYCGKDHSRMIGRVIVMDPADYEDWLAAGAPEKNLVQEGAELFRSLGCSGCHVGSQVVRAPPLEGLFGRPVPLMSGEVVIADERYIHDSIVLPNSQVAAGYEPLMPSFQGTVSEEEIFKLLAYIRSLADVPVRSPAMEVRP